MSVSAELTPSNFPPLTALAPITSNHDIKPISVKLLALDRQAKGALLADVLSVGGDVRAPPTHFILRVVVAEPDGRVERTADARAVAGTSTRRARPLGVLLQVVDALLQPTVLYRAVAAHPADGVVLSCPCACVEALKLARVLVSLSIHIIRPRVEREEGKGTCEASANCSCCCSFMIRTLLRGVRDLVSLLVAVDVALVPLPILTSSRVSSCS